ncbi:hypothetical protein HPP92_019347 [Vanilla planifolia]|uniref:Uncharacterized protein n=1 Tax=Vanilla planifolia TaxID=51239 RepID=A0A835Q697_VANPL|nr:hypothetical protein HPP92_019347 [Vanilla planifolia]
MYYDFPIVNLWRRIGQNDMGRKWILAVKKIFSAEPKENNCEKPKKKCGKSKDSASSSLNQSLTNAEKGQTKQTRSIAMATAVAAEAAVVAARAAAEVVRLTTSFKFHDGRSREQVAAIKIQAAFRGYLARRWSGALRGLFRLRLLSNSIAVKRQTTNTLHYMQTLARVQSQVRERRLKLSEENQALHKQRQLKREKELEQLKQQMGEDWVDSPQSKEQLEAKLLKRQEAALRRERSLAYAYSHQWRSKSTRSNNATFIDPANQQWSWSWLDRWMAARPWEGSRGNTRKDYFSDRSSMKSNGSKWNINSCKPSRLLNRTVPSNCSSGTSNDDLLAFQSVQRRRRHSIGGSFSIRCEDSLAGLPTRTTSRFHAPPTGNTKVKAGSLMWKQQKSFPGAGVNKKPNPSSATARRFSTSPKVSSYATGMW